MAAGTHQSFSEHSQEVWSNQFRANGLQACQRLIHSFDCDLMPATFIKRPTLQDRRHRAIQHQPVLARKINRLGGELDRRLRLSSKLANHRRE